MADTFTPKLGLRQYDAALNYAVSKFSADNLLIDNAIGTVICTSTTRPSTSLFNGMQLWETDTQRFVVRVAGAWVAASANPIIVANQAARDAITTKYDGQTVYRQDTDWLEIYDGAAWRVQGHVPTSALANITNPMAGQTCLLTTENMVYRWTGSAWLASYAAGGITTSTRHNATDYDTNDWTTSFVSPGIVFTCARAGNWGVTFNSRFAGAVAGERAFTLAANGSPMGTVYGTYSNYAGGTAPWSGCVHIEQDFSVGDTVGAFAYQGAVAGLGFDLTSSPTSITFEFRGPKNT
jgi:hypothetical protein